MKTRNVGREYANNYLRRAKECKDTMSKAAEEKMWNACVINAIHCAIASTDAICIHKLGMRSASERHSDVVVLLSSIQGEEIKQAVKHLSHLLDIKTDAEYGERLATQKDAEQAMSHT